jgi:hypothetical protein
MLPLILVAVGAYLIGDSVLGDKKYAKGGYMADGGEIGDSVIVELNNGKKIEGKIEKLNPFKIRTSPSSTEVIPNSYIKSVKKMAHGGKTQGYDDKENERLAMEHGKMSKKDLDSTHARRDDARFEERGKMAKGGKTKKGDIGKSGTQYGYTLKEYEEMGEKNGLFVSPKEWWSSREGKKYTDSFGRTKTIGTNSQDERQEMQSYGYRIAIGMDLGSDKIPPSARKYVIENNLTKEQQKLAKGGKLVGKQKNLDVNKNGKLDAEDFKMLRKGKKMADGGLVVKSDEDLREIAKYMVKAIKKRADFKDLVYYFEKDNNYDYNYRVKIWDEMNVYEMKKTEENVYKVLKAIVDANEAKK